MKRVCNYCSVIDSGCIFKVIGLSFFFQYENVFKPDKLGLYFVWDELYHVSEGRLNFILFNVNNTLKMKNHKYISITRINISNII